MQKRKLKPVVKNILFLSIIVVIAGIVLAVFTLNNNDKKKTEEKPNIEQKEEVKEEPVEEEVEEPTEKRMSIVMTGDALLHGAVFMDAYKNGKYDFTSMFTLIAPIVKKYDLKYYNQETIIGGGAPAHYPRFNSPKAIGDNLTSIGFNLVSLANNHTLDRGESGLKHSVNYWKTKATVVTAGSYGSKAERDEVPVYERNGIKYAFLAYTTCTNGLSTPAGKSYYLNVYSNALAKKDIDQAKKNGAEVIIVAMHWGVEYTHKPNNEQKTIAKYLSSQGVNLIIGSHPHVIQPIEYVGETLVVYSLGNLISAQRVMGIEKIIGLLVGTDIVVKDGKVTFENTGFELLYTYYTASNRNFKVYPFSKLTTKVLSNHASLNKKYRKIVDLGGKFNGTKEQTS